MKSPTEVICQNEEVIRSRAIILKQIEIAISNCTEYLTEFKDFDYIWLEDKDVYLKQFIDEWPNGDQTMPETNLDEEDNRSESDMKLESFQNQVCMKRKVVIKINPR